MHAPSHRRTPANIAFWFTAALMIALPAADQSAGAARDDGISPLYPASAGDDPAQTEQGDENIVPYAAVVRRLTMAWGMPVDEREVGRLRRPLGIEGRENVAMRGEQALVRWIIQIAREADGGTADEGDGGGAGGADEAPAAQAEEERLATRRETLRMLHSLGRWQRIEPRFGLLPWSPLDQDANAAIARGSGRAVVLVHGLDDPGWMWDDLAPALENAGHVVLEFLYPNDGPVDASADLLALVLARLDGAAEVKLDIVAHSMGGLVVRDMLTRPLLEGARTDILPGVDRFIMCGTPNHGSALAPLWTLTDLRERAVRGARGEDMRSGSLEEGRGLAALDLAPGSPLLRALAARPLPQDVAITIIAGRLVIDPDTAIGDAADRARKTLKDGDAPNWATDMVNRLDRALRQAATGAIAAIGDGMVPLESAKLEGVEDLRIVEANHASMLMSRFGGPPVPPAIPIILDRLSRPTPGSQ